MDMKEEYDLSNGLRGLFNPSGIVKLPAVHLDRKMVMYLMRHASKEGSSLDVVTNELLKEAIKAREIAR
jgi:hypothetical protein